MWRFGTLLARRYSRTSLFSSPIVFKTWVYILSLYNLSLSTPNYEETLIVAIKQGGTVKTAIDDVNETIDSMINRSYFLVTDRFPRGQIVEEQWHINKNFIDWRGRDLRYLNYRFVSRRGASLDAGTDVN